MNSASIRPMNGPLTPHRAFFLKMYATNGIEGPTRIFEKLCSSIRIKLTRMGQH